jgi:uncharacterized membrane-anchored protein
MRKWIVVLAALAILLGVNLVIAARERLLEEGRVVLLELAPVDPRSLMQGDYMALRLKVARDMPQATTGDAQGGHVVLAVDTSDVASFRRLDDGTSLAPDEVKMRYRVRQGAPKFATNAFFFEEGRASDYNKARFGEFRVAPDGEAILTGLRDAAFVKLGKAQ